MRTLALTLLLVASTAAGAPPRGGSRDVAVIHGDGSGGAGRDLSRLSEAELARRLHALERENRRAFSDERVLRIDAFRAELERRRAERDWDAETRRREAADAAANAKLEERVRVDEQRRRDLDEVAERALAAARAARDEQLQGQQILEETERHRVRVRRTTGVLLSLFGLGAIGFAAWRWWRRS